MSALSLAIENTTKGFLQSYVDAAQTKNTQLVSTYLAEDCRRSIGPPYYLRSVGAPADFTMSNDEYASEFGTMEFYTFEAHEFYDLTIDTTNLKAGLRSELTGKFIDGKELSRTFVWFLDFNEDGSKIVKVYQHNDAEEGKNFRLTVKAYREAKEKTAK
jgi:hypothetical protein